MDGCAGTPHIETVYRGRTYWLFFSGLAELCGISRGQGIITGKPFLSAPIL